MSLQIPKVSVVIPCYNDKDYIQETVQSVLNQTFQDFEIIIVDDGSNEATKKVLSSFNDKIKIVTQHNQGSSSARNSGIKEAKANYILIIDGDDTVEKTFLEKAIEILDNNPTICAVSSYCNLFVNTNTITHRHMPKGGGVTNFLFDNNSVSFALIRKKCWETIGGYDEQMKNGFEDWEFWISMTKKGQKVHIIEEFLFNYRQKEQNSVDKKAKKYYRATNLNYIYKKHQDIFSERFSQTIDYLTEIANRNQKNEIKCRNSIDFKIGSLLLRPFRLIKNFFKG